MVGVRSVAAVLSAILALLAHAPPLLGADLLGGKRAILKDGPGTARDLASVTFARDASLVGTLPDPTALASSLRLTTDAGEVVAVLDAAFWRALGSGFGYTDTTGSAAGVRKIRVKPGPNGGKLKLLFKGDNYGTVALSGPVQWIEASLTIGTTTYCGRFESPPGTISRNEAEIVKIAGPSGGCSPPAGTPTATNTAIGSTPTASATSTLTTSATPTPTDTLSATPTKTNGPPLAELNDGPIVVEVGQAVSLWGGASADPDGDPLLFDWTFESVPAASSLDATDITQAPADPGASFVPDVGGVFVVEMTITEDTPMMGSATDKVTVVAQDPVNLLPNADAGADQVVRVGSLYQLDGRRSRDPESAVPAAYSWQQIAGPGSALASGDHPTLMAPTTPGVMTFQLTVTDAGGQTSPPDFVDVTVIDDGPTPIVPPYARFDVLPAGLVHAGDSVILDGSVSQTSSIASDYHWRQVSGPGIDSLLPLGDTALLSLTEDLPGTYVFELLLESPSGLFGRPFHQAIHALPTGAFGIVGVKVSLFADSLARSCAGEVGHYDLDLATGPPIEVRLQANQLLENESTDCNSFDLPWTPPFVPVRYSWRQRSGPFVPMSDPTARDPVVTLSQVGVYEFEVTAIDADGLRPSAVAFVSVSSDHPDPLIPLEDDFIPIANFDPVPGGTVGMPFGLTGFGSDDPDDGIAEFVFEQTAGLPVVLSGAPGIVQTGVPLAPGFYEFRLFVIDGEGRRSRPATQSFEVAEP